MLDCLALLLGIGRRLGVDPLLDDLVDVHIPVGLVAVVADALDRLAEVCGAYPGALQHTVCMRRHCPIIYDFELPATSEVFAPRDPQALQTPPFARAGLPRA